MSKVVPYTESELELIESLKDLQRQAIVEASIRRANIIRHNAAPELKLKLKLKPIAELKECECEDKESIVVRLARKLFIYSMRYPMR